MLGQSIAFVLLISFPLLRTIFALLNVFRPLDFSFKKFHTRIHALPAEKLGVETFSVSPVGLVWNTSAGIKV